MCIAFSDHTTRESLETLAGEAKNYTILLYQFEMFQCLGTRIALEQTLFWLCIFPTEGNTDIATTAITCARESIPLTKLKIN